MGCRARPTAGLGEAATGRVSKKALSWGVRTHGQGVLGRRLTRPGGGSKIGKREGAIPSSPSSPAGSPWHLAQGAYAGALRGDRNGVHRVQAAEGSGEGGVTAAQGSPWLSGRSSTLQTGLCFRSPSVAGAQ